MFTYIDRAVLDDPSAFTGADRLITTVREDHARKSPEHDRALLAAHPDSAGFVDALRLALPTCAGSSASARCRAGGHVDGRVAGSGGERDEGHGSLGFDANDHCHGRSYHCHHD